MFVAQHVAALTRDIKQIESGMKEPMPDAVRAGVEDELLLLKVARSVLMNRDIERVREEFTVGRAMLRQRRSLPEQMRLARRKG